jgi:hypothetical protein
MQVVFRKTKQFSRKSSSFLFFNDFYMIFHCDELSRMQYFKFFRSVLTKYFQIHSSFFEFFISKFLKISNETD